MTQEALKFEKELLAGLSKDEVNVLKQRLGSVEVAFSTESGSIQATDIKLEKIEN